MKKASTLLYSVIASFLFLEVLLTVWSIFPAGSSDWMLRIGILLVCFLSIAQLYTMHVGSSRLTPLSYWPILATNSAACVYFKYFLDHGGVSTPVLHTSLVVVSFFTWILLLVLGVLYRFVDQRAEGSHVLD